MCHVLTHFSFINSGRWWIEKNGVLISPTTWRVYQIPEFGGSWQGVFAEFLDLLWFWLDQRIFMVNDGWNVNFWQRLVLGHLFWGNILIQIPLIQLIMTGCGNYRQQIDQIEACLWQVLKNVWNEKSNNIVKSDVFIMQSTNLIILPLVSVMCDIIDFVERKILFLAW